ncbi:MAG: hypothetical protein JO258_05160 [Alphaproteobacteria bacterium]|nr:hypothetical protein [Alphaproteobacteria bacterium]
MFTTIIRSIRAAALSAAIAGMAGTAALAMGNNDSDSPTCPRGEVYNSNTKKCEPQRRGALPDKQFAAYAYALAKAKRYDEAIDVLNLMKNPDTAEALNYRGYATRHLGKLDDGIAFYLRSVRRDPHYALVREYLGEAYVLKGDVASARYQLRRIRQICGNTACEPYEDLEKAIAGHPEDEG